MVQVSTERHALCGVVLARGKNLLLLVRNSHSNAVDKSHLSDLKATMTRHAHGASVSVEVVDARGAYTQADEGSCALHAIMYIMHLLDVCVFPLQRGDLDDLRNELLQRPPPIYALIALRIGSFYGGEFRARGWHNTILVKTVPITLVSASDMDRPLLSVQRSALVNGLPSTARVVARIAPDGGIVLLESALKPAPSEKDVTACAKLAAAAVYAAYGILPRTPMLKTGVLYGRVEYRPNKRELPSFGACMLYTDV